MEQKYFGSYRITGTLGEGAFGVVYQAYQPFLDRQVAIKTLQNARTGDPMTEQDFMREARTIARLRHNNIINVYEFATAPLDGQPVTYMVMEYLPGDTLSDRLKRGRLPLVETVHILERLASALDYAHARRVIHRDLKPANIMFNEHSEPVMLDFGLAKLAELTDIGENDNPQASHARGTPAYMAPEQITAEAVGAAADQYAMGLIAFQMLTGVHPFDVEQSVTQILVSRIQDKPRRLVEVTSEFPEAATLVFDRVLSVEPTSRFNSVTEFVRALVEAVLPDRSAARVILVPDPAQAALLRAARQTLSGMMWGLLGMLAALMIFCVALVSNGYLSGSPVIFVWDGVYTELGVSNGWRTVTGTFPGSVGRAAGILPGDKVKGDLLRDARQVDTDYSINTIPRASLSIAWQPGPGDTISRSVDRSGTLVPVSYTLASSPYMVLLMALSFPPALVSLTCAAWLLRRWGAEPGLQAFFLLLISLSVYQLSALLSQLMPVLQAIVGFLVISAVIHFMLVFPRRLALLERRPNVVWFVYLPVLLPLLLFMFGLAYFTQWLTIATVLLLAMVLVMIGLFVFKWLRHDYQRYPGMGLFLIGFGLVVLNALLSVLNRSMNYQTMMLMGITGFEQDMLFQGIRFVGASINPIIQAVGYHRIQKRLGSSLPPEIEQQTVSTDRALSPAALLKSIESSQS